MPTETTLVLGWGNPGRRDDGLGPALAEALAGLELPGVSIEIDYQLQVEHVEELARHGRVLFVDAARGGAEPFRFERLAATADGPGFTTHSVSPGALLTLARDLYQAEPAAWLLGIRGYDFDEFGEGLSVQARRNLAEALEFVSSALRSEAFPPTHLPDPEAEPCKTTSP